MTFFPESTSLGHYDPSGSRTTYAYDSSGRLVSVMDARGFISTTVYNARGEVVSSINALGQTTEFFYDAVGRQVAVETPLGYRTTTVYNLAGQVVSSIDALGNTTTYAYDDAGNQIRVTNPLGYSITSIYESSSNLLSAVQNQISNRTTYTFDPKVRGSFLPAYPMANRHSSAPKGPCLVRSRHGSYEPLPLSSRRGKVSWDASAQRAWDRAVRPLESHRSRN